MFSLNQMVRRSGDNNIGLSNTLVDLLISLLVLVLLALALVGGLFIIRRKRRSNKESVLPVHNGQVPTSQRRLTITANKHDSVMVYDEKRALMENSIAPHPARFPRSASPSPRRRMSLAAASPAAWSSFGSARPATWAWNLATKSCPRTRPPTAVGSTLWISSAWVV